MTKKHESVIFKTYNYENTIFTSNPIQETGFMYVNTVCHNGCFSMVRWYGSASIYLLGTSASCHIRWSYCRRRKMVHYSERKHLRRNLDHWTTPIFNLYRIGQGERWRWDDQQDPSWIHGVGIMGDCGSVCVGDSMGVRICLYENHFSDLVHLSDHLHREIQLWNV